jgi:hypothetical protein
MLARFCDIWWQLPRALGGTMASTMTIGGGALAVFGLAFGCARILDLRPGIGLCEGVTCAATDACHIAGICDPNTGECSNPAAPTGTACNDYNACTAMDSCQGEICVGQVPVDCSVADACHPGACDPDAGCANNPAATDGTACDDKNVCTRTDTCQGGTCVGKEPVDCSVKDACHPAGTCDPANGCTAATDGTACNDGDGCSAADTCQSGICNPGGDHAWAHWDLQSPLPPQRYVSTPDVVFDKLTGRTWQRVMPGERYDWQGAKDYCARLTTIPGYPSGWRLPTRIELASIVDYTMSDPSIDAAIFTTIVPASYADFSFWTSSLASDGSGAWLVYFGGGDALTLKVSESYHVRCVR